MDSSTNSSRGPPPPPASTTTPPPPPPTTTDSTPTDQTTDVDEYDLAAHAVTDGFRPSNRSPRSNVTPPSTTTASSQPTFAPQLALANLLPSLANNNNSTTSSGPLPTPTPRGLTPMLNRPSSISKPPRPHDSLQIRNDGSNEHVPGPAHPYHMFTERPSSNTAESTSTIEAEPTVTAAQPSEPPVHAYNIYTQVSVSSESDSHTSSPILPHDPETALENQPAVSRRQDTSDLPGLAEHSEQLPPYTRYPEVSMTRKPADNGQPGSSSAASGSGSSSEIPGGSTFGGSQSESASLSPSLSSSSVSPATAAATTTARRSITSTELQSRPPTQDQQHSVEAIPGAGGIGIATRNPEFASTQDTLAASHSRASSQSSHDINMGARDMAEKPKVNKWQRRAKKKLWGVIPYWAICLTFVGMLIMGTVMGAVIGTVLANQKNDDDDNNKDTPQSNDVEPVMTYPANLKPLPTGAFSLSIRSATNTASACVTNQDQKDIWKCKLPGSVTSYNITSDATKPLIKQYNLAIKPLASITKKITYGAQPPDIKMQLRLVKDVFESRNGLAWYGSRRYDKTIFIQRELLAKFLPADMDRGELPATGKQHEGRWSAKDGDEVWVCNWPNVAMDIYLYPNAEADISSSTASPSPTPTPTPTASPTGTNSTNTPVPSMDIPDRLPPFPRSVKIVERLSKGRVDSPPVGSCRLVRVTSGGTSTEAVLNHDKPVQITIKVTPDKLEKQMRLGYHGRSLDNRPEYGLMARSTTPQSISLSSCGCLWNS